MLAVVKMLSNRPTCTSTARAEGQVMKHEQVESKWTISEMKDIVHQERMIRRQAQLAAEQALTAAKEAQKVILQLEEELGEKDHQLQQERAARKQAELASEEAADVVARASSEDIQRQSSSADVLKKENLSSPHSDTTGDVTVSEVQTAELKRPRDDTLAQSPVKKPRGPDKSKVKATQGNPDRQNMSLEEARKFAIEETKKRMQERAAALTGTKH